MAIEINQEQLLDVITSFVQPSGKLWFQFRPQKLRQNEQPVVGYVTGEKDPDNGFALHGIFSAEALPILKEIGATTRSIKVREPKEWIRGQRARFKLDLPISNLSKQSGINLEDSREQVALGGIYLGERAKEKGLTAFVPASAVRWQRISQLPQGQLDSQQRAVTLKDWPRFILKDPDKMLFGQVEGASYKVFLANDSSTVWWTISRELRDLPRVTVETQHETPFPLFPEYFDVKTGKRLEISDYVDLKGAKLDTSSFTQPEGVAEEPPIIHFNYGETNETLVITDGYRLDDFDLEFPRRAPRSKTLVETGNYFHMFTEKRLDDPVVVVRNRAGCLRDKLYVAQLPYLLDPKMGDFLERQKVRGHFNNSRGVLMNYLGLKGFAEMPEAERSRIQEACQRAIEEMKSDFINFGIDPNKTDQLEDLLRRHNLLS